MKFSLYKKPMDWELSIKEPVHLKNASHKASCGCIY